LRIALAGVVILLLCPLMVLIAAAIRLESPGPVLVRNSRTGALLFRTTTVHGGRVTRLGSLLQQSSLNKLPQLISWIIDKG
jgi:putative colanic acid biosynthesis UDP-glucose lipid carrier transferase